MRKISSCRLSELDKHSDEDCTEECTITTAGDIGLDLTDCFDSVHRSSRRVRVNEVPTIIPFVERRLLNRDSVTALLHDFYEDLTSNASSKSRECWKAFYEKYHSPEYTMVRPSGNPCHSSDFIDMFCSEDCQLIRLQMVSVETVQVIAGGLVAVVTYTVDQRFIYKGEPQEDRVCLTCIMEEREGDIRICHEHRSTGHPIPKTSRWDNQNCDKRVSTAPVTKVRVLASV